MFRRRITSALPVLPSLLVGLLWGRSYFYSDTYAGYRDVGRTRWVQFSSTRGSLFTAHVDEVRVRPKGTWLEGYACRKVPAFMRKKGVGVGRRFMGFFHYDSGNAAKRRVRMWGMPYWAVFVATLPPSLLWLRRFVRDRVGRRRREAGLCPGCEYDLRASPGRCPECGRRPSMPEVFV